DTETQLDPREKFKVDNFYTILDCLRNELEHRVNAYSEIKKLFSFLTEYGRMKYDDLKAQLELVVSTYSSDLEASVLDEFCNLKTFCLLNLT
ncbi:putative repressor of the inhibitor of the protein kinase-like 2, partial [Homarus americanus]